MISKRKSKNCVRLHIVRTWGEAKETIDYLECNMYEGVKHLIGELYICTKMGSGLSDVAVLV